MTTMHQQLSEPRPRRDACVSVAEAVGAAPRCAVRPRNRRQDVVLALTATALGLWFGFGAPSVSPVAPPVPVASSTSVGSEAAGSPDSAAAPAAPAGRGGTSRGPARFGQQGRRR